MNDGGLVVSPIIAGGAEASRGDRIGMSAREVSIWRGTYGGGRPRIIRREVLISTRVGSIGSAGSSSPGTIGTIATWDIDRGFGFCQAGPRRVFVHVSDVKGLRGRGDHPVVGDEVEFDLTETDRGPRAVDARIVRRVE